MERARYLLDNHRQNHEILSQSLRLPSELPRASTERVFISVLQERKRRYKEVKHLPKVTQQSRSRRIRWAAVGGRVDGHKGEHRGQESAEKWECSGQAGSHGEEKGQ